MAQIGTKINPKDSSFLENKKKMLESINMLESFLNFFTDETLLPT